MDRLPNRDSLRHAPGRMLKIAMKKFIILASAGLLLFSLEGAWAQRQVEPPAVPPMLEGNKPLAQPETREPATSQPTEVGTPKAKAKPKTKAKTGKKTQKKAVAKKENGKTPPKVAKKKSQKNQKKKPPEAVPKPQAGPEEG
jgi:hypothetical protein